MSSSTRSWQGVFGRRSRVPGQHRDAQQPRFTVVGILPSGFRVPFDEVEVWIPHHHCLDELRLFGGEQVDADTCLPHGSSRPVLDHGA